MLTTLLESKKGLKMQHTALTAAKKPYIFLCGSNFFIGSLLCIYHTESEIFKLHTWYDETPEKLKRSADEIRSKPAHRDSE